MKVSISTACSGRRFLWIAAMAGLLSGARGALADTREAAAPEDAAEAHPQGSSANTDTAREHFQRGIRFYNDGDSRLALVEFTRAYELSHSYRILYNIGQVNLELNNYSKAILAFEQYLREGGESIPAERRAGVDRDLADCRGKTARVEVVVAVKNADVLVDDVPVGRTPLAQPLVLDVGEHRLLVRKGGYDQTERRVSLAARDSIKVELVLRKHQPLLVMKAPATKLPEQPGRASPWLWAGWFGTGALAVGAGVTAYFAVSRATDLATLRDSPDSTATERTAVENQARRYALASDVLTGAAVVAGATTLYFTLRPSRGPEEAPKTGSRWGIGPTGVTWTQTY